MHSRRCLAFCFPIFIYVAVYMGVLYFCLLFLQFLVVFWISGFFYSIVFVKIWHNGFSFFFKGCCKTCKQAVRHIAKRKWSATVKLCYLVCRTWEFLFILHHIQTRWRCYLNSVEIDRVFVNWFRLQAILTK